jgi:maleylacetoacetate isomerase
LQQQGWQRVKILAIDAGRLREIRMKLYGYWRSSATYRVRIALALKQLDYDYHPINLVAGEQRADDYLALNPQGLVPTLVTDEGARLTQSTAIIEYLEERYPERPLLPSPLEDRARARAIASICACEAQPFMNLRVQQYLKDQKGYDDAALAEWLDRWVGGAMRTIEQLIDGGAAYCVGDAPSIADCFLAPQTFGALRFGVDLSGAPKIMRLYDAYQKHEAFRKAAPGAQPDAPKEAR